MRLDKFLWCVRLFKSRSLATEACNKARARMNAKDIKPSVEVRVNDAIAVRQPPIWREFNVLAIPPSRVGAKLVSGYLAETTPWEELEKQEIARKVRTMQRDHGSGRPTKRDRRDIGRFVGD